ncbi:MAG TPA: heme-binding protein [Rhodopirellula baltica]|uniref:Cytochrome c domain-containing protein n=1 Tax=Rhodopirellula baltica (strain DSM 10527 / NCIMB 13988 / SH1) TaxID=243090 RepID=Q7UWV9_RHOBA|nr:c-type cytochrome [Rhodopirellula baltica]CAD72253.1 hypothetical protein-transmembrane prediction [Rhodopirellula baltica SH 1]HBE66207.1 heme-binding protein [Rhodopirellula baltica]
MPLIQFTAAMLFVLLGGIHQSWCDEPRRTSTTKSNRPKLLRPDLILQSLESPDVSVRRQAVLDLSQCHAKHPNLVPGAMQLLRRSANDSAFDVVIASIEAAATIGDLESFGAVAEVLRGDHTPSEAGRILDAIDVPSLRPFWKSSDPFRVADAAKSLQQKATRQHSVASLAKIKIPTPSSTVIASGREAFMIARCDACHQVAGYGRASGPDLRGIGMCYSNTELIRHILQPSLDLHDTGRFEKFLLTDGRVITGRVIANNLASTDRSSVQIQTDLSNPDAVLSIELKDIEQRQPSPISPMPVGLLNSLTPTQVAELVVYLRSDGGRLAPADSSHEH